MNLPEAGNPSKRWTKFFICAVSLVAALTGRTLAADYSWTNSAGGNWNNSLNWNPNTVPSFGDNAYITNNGTYTVTNSSATSVNNVFVGGSSGTQSLLISGVAFMFTNMVFPQTNGSLIGSHGVLTLSGTPASLSMNGPLAVAGTFNWSGGAIGGAAAMTVATNGLLQILSASSNQLRTTVFNYGTATWTNSSASFYFSRLLPAAVFVNEPGGLFDNRNGPTMAFVGGLTPPPTGAGFYNSGLFRKVGGNTTTTAIQVPFYNSGTIQPLFGNLAFNYLLSLSSSSVLQFSIRGLTPGSQYGTIAIAPSPTPPGTVPALPTLGTPGSVQLAGALNVSLTNGYLPNVSDAFSLMSYTSKQGTFDSSNLGSLTNSPLTNGLFFHLQESADRKSILTVIDTTNSPPVVAPTNMMDQTVAIGDTANFSPPAFGVAPFTFQWLKNGTNLLGETNVNLIISNAQPSDAGSYSVTVTDATNAITSYFATLTVLSPQIITTQPVSQTVTLGSQVILTVSVSSQSPLSYQWRRNAVNIPGATSPTNIVTTNALASDGGSYDLLVAGPVSTIISTVAVVTVASPPLLFSSFPGGSTNGISFVGSGDNTTATNQPDDPPIDGNPASHRLYAQWQAPADGAMKITTLGSGFDTVLGVFTGTTRSNLTLLTGDDDADLSDTSQATFQAHSNVVYVLAADGFAGLTGPITVSGFLNTNLNIPTIFSQPQDQTAPLGGSATFSVSVSNAVNVHYQWSKGDVVKIPGATNSTLTVSNVDPTSVDVYSVAVTSGTNAQSVDSVRATLEIGPSLSYRKLGLLTRAFNGGPLPFGPEGRGNFLTPAGSFSSVSVGSLGSQSMNNFGSSGSQSDPPVYVGTGGSPRWLLLTAADSATMVVDTMTNDNNATVLLALIGTGYYAQPIATNHNGAPDGIHSLVRFTTVAGSSYLFEANFTNSSQPQGTVNLNWRMGIPPGAGGTPQNLMLTNGAYLLLQAGQSKDVTDPTYQWQLNGVNIQGATNANYTNSSMQFNQVGSYTVVVSNLVGQVVNAIATVSVQAPLNLAKDLSVHPANFRITGSSTQVMVLQLSTNLVLSAWKPLYTNTTTLLPINYLDTDSATRTQGFYRYKLWP